MPENFYSLVTDYCLKKQLSCIQSNSLFEVYQIALGDGNGKYYEPTNNQTQLVNEVWRGLIEKCEWENNKFYCLTTVPAEVGGFTVREAGVFDKENNLLVISKFPETTKQSANSGTIKQLTIRIEIHLSNAELANLIINPNIETVTKDEFTQTLTDFQIKSEKGSPNGYAPLGQNGLIPESFLPKIETKSILTPFCLNSCRLDSKGNPDLLTCTTVKVLKYTSSELGVFYVPLNFTFEKGAVVFSDTELTQELATIVAFNTTNSSIAFGEIETLSEFEDEPLHYSATNVGDFYVQETLALGAECFSDSECTQSIGFVTYLNLTKISIGKNETYTSNGNITTHIYITAHAPFIYTTASSVTHYIEEDLILDVVDLCPNNKTVVNFNLFVTKDDDTFSLIALSNKIFSQMLEPKERNLNDIWFKILEPLTSYIYLLNIWQETNLVPIGTFALEGGEN